MAAEFKIDFVPVRILPQPLVEVSALVRTLKLDFASKSLVQVMVHGLHGNRGEHVHCLVQEVLSAGFEHAQTRLRLSVESIAREVTKRRSLVIPFPAQWMETGPNGDLGADVQ